MMPPSVMDQTQSRSSRIANTRTRTLNHTLNKSKALQKKLDSCHRPDTLTIDVTGGGIVITCISAYYELVKANIMDYIASTNFMAKCDAQIDGYNRQHKPSLFR